ncbi:MAG: hypothetical protein IPH07_37855 [Deltaproteobacteria bacterium]|nr:hypothetical protein [Deltaproteobacteria bacterium]MBK8235962.1 hypothetical protein [Deltaproteobacteria bacterium]MBK8713594.1 hypothetical protein [Deltaproteobacteria bacterium]MBP7291987.1 hypothetical protein [Nannocystaceae bacterium]
MTHFQRIGALVLVAGTAACFDPDDRAATTTDGADASSDGSASSTAPAESSSEESGSATTTSTPGDSSGSSTDTDNETSAADPVCGNGVPEPGEACDLGEATPECSLRCTACEPPSPTSVLDQQLTVCEGGAYSDCRDSWSMANGQSGLQGVRVSQSGTLDSIALYVANEAIATTVHTVQLVDGGNSPLFPVGATTEMLEAAVVATATATGTAEFGWVDFDFADAQVQLDPDRDYFIWLRMLAPFPDDANLRLRWNLFASPELTDPYAGGQSFFCSPGAPCDTNLSYWDFAFRLRLVPDPPLCE